MRFSSSLLSSFVLLAGLVNSQTIYEWEQIGADVDGENYFDKSGYSVSLSSDGNTVAIGAIWNNPTNSLMRAGQVRVKQYNNITDTWVQIGDDIDGEFINDNSGYSVALSSNGTRVAIGGWKNSVGTGHVRVYEYNSNWYQLGTDMDGEARGDHSGNSVAINAAGDIVAIGAYLNDGVNGPDSGQVRVFTYDGSDWDRMGVDIDGEDQGDQFGTSVSLSDSGMVMAVGATKNDGAVGEDSGHVRVYEWKSGAWQQIGNDIEGEAEKDNSGISVALSGNGRYVAVGAYNNDGSNTSEEDVGHVRVWQHVKGVGWQQVGGDIDGEADNDESGRSVSLSYDGTVLAVGAWHNDGVNGTDSGHVRVHKYENSVWTQLGLDIDGESKRDESGGSVSIDDEGNTVAIGAWYNKGDNKKRSGHTRVYQLTSQNTGTGFNGDPVILGFKDQVFKFEGRDGGWYSNLAAKNMQWNMQFRKFNTCPKDADMFISSMSLALFDDNAKRLNSILIVTTPEPTPGCMADPNMVCLGGGTLHISFDGGETFLSQPGDFHFGSNARIVAHNTYAACSRKWHDYEVSVAQAKNKIRNSERYLGSHLEKKPVELLIQNKAEMIDKNECSTWIQDRVENNDLFQQRGHWSTVYIETSLVSFHIEYRRSDFFNPDCDFQSLDAWMTKVDPKLEQSGDWNGILGETKHKIFDQTTGEQIKTDRSRLLRSLNDADYEVSDPFETEFAALTMAKPSGGSVGQMVASIVESMESSIFSSN